MTNALHARPDAPLAGPLLAVNLAGAFVWAASGMLGMLSWRLIPARTDERHLKRVLKAGLAIRPIHAGRNVTIFGGSQPTGQE